MGGQELIQITGFQDKEFTKKIDGQNSYTFMMNPDSIKLQRTIDYNEEQPPGSLTPSQRYRSTAGDKLNFDIVIDCTGIVSPERVNMEKEISALEYIVFTYDGEIHPPNYVVIQWGKWDKGNGVVFKGVLNSFDTSYTVFRQDGSPLRAKASLIFSKYLSLSTAKKKSKKESPDVTHHILVKEGVTLPLLCYNVWNDDSYYTQVARFNNLNKFRNLKGIRMLIFPPIIQPS